MTPDFIKEHIKLETELLRLYFVLFLTDVSGTVALVGKISSKSSAILFALGVVFAFVLGVLMRKKENKIRNLTNHLNT